MGSVKKVVILDYGSGNLRSAERALAYMDLTPFDALEDDFPDFSYDTLPPREEPWLYPATRLRCAIESTATFASGTACPSGCSSGRTPSSGCSPLPRSLRHPMRQ